MTLSFTSNLIQLENKISIENYPTIIYENPLIHESDIYLTLLNRSWMNVDNSTLKDFLKTIIDNKFSFCPSTFIQTKFKFVGYPVKLDYYFSYYNNKSIITSKEILPYDTDFKKENHVWRSKNTFKSCRILVVDIDEGYNSLDEIQIKISESPLKDCSFIYKTPSYNKELNKIKVRIGWILDEEITDINELEMYLSFLCEYFKADKSCVDASRFYFPGKELVYVNEDIVFNKEQFKLYDSIIKENKSKLIKNYNNIIVNDKSEFIKILKDEYLYSFQTDKILNFNWSKNINNIREFKLFNRTHLKYAYLFSFALNLNMISGGLKWLKENMILNNEKGISHYNEIDFQIIQNIKHYDYIPESFDFFDRCKNKKNYMFEKTLQIEKPKMSIVEAEKERDSIFDYIINSKENYIYILKFTTGLGKTQLLHYLQRKGLIIACQTHDLKNELYNDIKDKYNYVLTPQRLKFKDEKLNNKISYFEQTGYSRFVSVLLKNYLKQPDANKEDCEYIQLNKLELKNCFNTDKNIITTHTMSKHINTTKHDTIIYDEDPINSFFKINRILGNDLEKLYNNDKFKFIVDYFINTIQTNQKQLLYDFNLNVNIELLEQELKENKIYNSNILGILKSKTFLFNPNTDNIKEQLFEHGIYYSTLDLLPTDKKIIIMSATISEDFYYSLYGKDKVKFYEITNIEYVGEVFLYNRYKFTPHSINSKNSKSLQYLLDNINEEPIITTKKNKHLFKHSHKTIHLGNSLGYNELKGKNINVVMALSKPSWTYILKYKSFFPKKELTNFNFGLRWIQYKNFKFQYATFEDLELQKIHLDDIKSELEQAIGRARPLREKVTVNVYASIPVDNANIMFEYFNK